MAKVVLRGPTLGSVECCAKYDEFQPQVNGLVFGKAVWGWEEDAMYVHRHRSSALMDGTHFVKYSEAISEQLEREYRKWRQDGGSGIVKLKNRSISKLRNSHTGSSYTIDFSVMQQQNRKTGFVRTLRRQRKAYASPPISPRKIQHVERKVEVKLAPPKPQSNKTGVIGAVVHDPRGFVGRTDTILPKKNTGLPKSWDMCAEGRVLVPSDSDEHKQVSRFFLDSLDRNVRIIRVERIQSDELWNCYAAKRDAMRRRSTRCWLPNKLGLNGREMVWLFHGTNEYNVSQIARHGFDRTLAGRHGAMYGKGSYFAREASVSLRFAKANSSGMKMMLLCRVAVGDWCQGHKDQLKPDPKPGTGDDCDRFDSTVDNVVNPSTFVVYHDAQAYPEYIVVFREADAL